ncbi:MAG: hypothetical protein A2Y38_11360 [Spirochaetes bacterium GWB1_59_5]|nr:MAG: hypothetical protein A2Y38_11360 [Spirochaetes bacterium GWB1_59_5]
MAPASLEDLSNFPEVPNLNPPEPLPDCEICKGWGVILGTDSPDSWGDDCDCGHKFSFLRFTAMDSQLLHSAHMTARLRAEVPR